MLRRRGVLGESPRGESILKSLGGPRTQQSDILSGMEHWEQLCRRHKRERVGQQENKARRRYPHGHVAGDGSTRAAHTLVPQLAEVYERRGASWQPRLALAPTRVRQRQGDWDSTVKFESYCSNHNCGKWCHRRTDCWKGGGGEGQRQGQKRGQARQK